MESHESPNWKLTSFKNEDVMKWREINNKWEVEHKAYMNQWLEERKKQIAGPYDNMDEKTRKKIYDDFAEMKEDKRMEINEHAHTIEWALNWWGDLRCDLRDWYNRDDSPEALEVKTTLKKLKRLMIANMYRLRAQSIEHSLQPKVGEAIEHSLQTLVGEPKNHNTNP